MNSKQIATPRDTTPFMCSSLPRDVGPAPDDFPERSAGAAEPATRCARVAGQGAEEEHPARAYSESVLRRRKIRTHCSKKPRQAGLPVGRPEGAEMGHAVREKPRARRRLNPELRSSLDG